MAVGCDGKDDDGARHIQQLHYPTAGPVPGSPEQRAVSPGSDVARRGATEMTKATPAQAGFLLIKLGEALHPLQDSWSNQGVPETPAFAGDVLKCDPMRAWAHAKARGGWNSHKADLTAASAADTLAMAQATYEYLVAYPAIGGVARKAKEWRDVAPALDGFIKAATKTDKKRWFVAQGLSDVSFLEGISLPDGAEPFALEWPRRRLPPLTTVNSTQHRTEPDLLAFYSQFFSRWATTDKLDALASEVIAGPAAGDRKAKRPADSMNKAQLAALLKIWRIHDHGSVADLAHAIKPLSAQQVAAVNAMAKKPKALATYANATQAFFPLLAKGPDASPLLAFVVAPAPPSPSGAQRAVAMAKFRHAPYDTIGAIAEKIDGQWKIIAIVSTVEH
jgi:hypothetical protein